MTVSIRREQISAWWKGWKTEKRKQQHSFSPLAVQLHDTFRYHKWSASGRKVLALFQLHSSKLCSWSSQNLTQLSVWLYVLGGSQGLSLYWFWNLLEFPDQQLKERVPMSGIGYIFNTLWLWEEHYGTQKCTELIQTLKDKDQVLCFMCGSDLIFRFKYITWSKQRNQENKRGACRNGIF